VELTSKVQGLSGPGIFFAESFLIADSVSPLFYSIQVSSFP
jgi:hypothetical protein